MLAEIPVRGYLNFVKHLIGHILERRRVTKYVTVPAKSEFGNVLTGQRKVTELKQHHNSYGQHHKRKFWRTSIHMYDSLPPLIRDEKCHRRCRCHILLFSGCLIDCRPSLLHYTIPINDIFNLNSKILPENLEVFYSTLPCQP